MTYQDQRTPAKFCNESPPVVQEGDWECINLQIHTMKAAIGQMTLDQLNEFGDTTREIVILGFCLEDRQGISSEPTLDHLSEQTWDNTDRVSYRMRVLYKVVTPEVSKALKAGTFEVDEYELVDNAKCTMVDKLKVFWDMLLADKPEDRPKGWAVGDIISLPNKDIEYGEFNKRRFALEAKEKANTSAISASEAI